MKIFTKPALNFHQVASFDNFISRSAKNIAQSFDFSTEASPASCRLAVALHLR